MRINILITLFYILVIAVWINGCFHSFRKHKDDPGWLQESPLVIYRGAEYFWHDDFGDIDWDKRLKADAFVMFTFISKIGTTTEIESLTTEAEKFSEKINSYPKERKEYLKECLKRVIRYSMSLSDDMIKYLDRLRNNESVIPKEWNSKSKLVQDTLIKEYDFQELNSGIQQIDTAMTVITMKYQSLQIADKEIEDMINRFRKAKVNDFNTCSRFYKMIFDEPYHAWQNSDL